ncbi:MAG: arsenic transporter [Myxococcales bacterium]|nr:arsenic transporter [Myxococcales bacterium]
MPLALDKLRAVLVTGKGGVGKTTVAAALARASARRGRRTLCLEVIDEVGEAAPLATTFGRALTTEEPLQVAPNLYVAALSPATGHKAFLRETLPVKMLADAAMKSQAVRRFLHAAPTFPELGVLYRLVDLASATRAGPFDQVIVDLPATGHALALVEVPEAVLRIVPGGTIGQALRAGLALLCDAEKTAALVVTLPEPLPVSEALELAEALEAKRVAVAGIILNRVPDDPFDDAEFELVQSFATRPLLGNRSVHRLRKTRDARERIKISRRVIELSEHPEGDVLAKVTDELAAGKP